MRVGKTLLLVIVLTAGSLCSACSPKQMWEGASKAAMVMWDPNMPVGPPKDQPSTVNVSLYAEPDVNVTDFGQAPVDVWVVQVSNEDQLMTTDFATFAKDPEDALGRSFEDMKTKQVKPGDSAVMPEWKLKEHTTAIGVVVAYAAISHPQTDAFGDGDGGAEPDPALTEMNLNEYRMMVALKKEGLIKNADWKRVEQINFEGENYGVYRPVPMGEGDGPLQWRAFETVSAKGETYNIVIPIRAKSVSVQVHR